MKIRNVPLFLAALILGLTTACGQATGPLAPTTLSAEAQPGVPAGWITNYAAALKLAKEQNRVVLVEFTGSDWCPPCKYLKKEVLDTAEFKEFAAENVILVYLDFPRNIPQTAALRAQNEALQVKFGVQGYPTIYLVGADGVVIGQTGLRRGSAADYVKHLKELMGAAG